jgi:hypothetical protein
MTLRTKLRILIKDERLRNKTFKIVQLGLMTGAAYLAMTFGKPHGTFGKANMLEG